LKIALCMLALLRKFSDNQITKFCKIKLVVVLGLGRVFLSSRHDTSMRFLRKEVAVGFPSDQGGAGMAQVYRPEPSRLLPALRQNTASILLPCRARV